MYTRGTILRAGPLALVAALIALVACVPFGGFPIGKPGPSSAAAQSPAEAAAIASVDGSAAAADAAGVASLVPGPQQTLLVAAQRYFDGYFTEINRQLAVLNARRDDADPRNDPEPVDFAWSIGWAMAAGAMTVFSYTRGHRAGRGAQA